MRRVPELLTLLKGMVAAVRSVSSALLLLLLITYVFAIIFATVLGGEPTYYEYWGTIPHAMYTLGIIGAVGDDSTAFMYDPEAMGEDIWHEHPLMLCVFLAYFFLANFTVLNMLIGILCDVISDTQASEKMKAKVREVEEKISLVYDSIDVDGSGKISAHEFDMIKNLDEVQEALSDLGILPNQFIALRDTLFNVEDEADNEDSAKKRVVKPRTVKLDPGVLEKADSGMSSSTKKRTSMSKDSLTKLQQAIEDREKKLQEANAEDPTRDIDFDEFIRICVSQRPENDMSVMDIGEIRKTARLGIRRLEKRSALLLNAVEQLPRRQQLETACINILKPLVVAAKAAKADWSTQNARANAAAEKVLELEARIKELEALPADKRPPRRKQPPHTESNLSNLTD
jgi:Ca2+-binding EF-hand superfamily protein